MTTPPLARRRALAAIVILAWVALLSIGGWLALRDSRPRLATPEGANLRGDAPAPLPNAAELDSLPATRSIAAPDDRPTEPGEDEPGEHADGMRSLLLHVIDHFTGAQLHEVTVRRAAPRGAPADELVRFDELVFVVQGAAPLRLLPPNGQPLHRDTLFVRASGYEQARIEIDWMAGGERTIELHPAGGLDLDLEGAPADTRFTVRLFSIDALTEEAEWLRRRIERLRRSEDRAASPVPPWLERKQRSLDSTIADLLPVPPSFEVESLLRSIPAQRIDVITAFSVRRIDDLAAGRWRAALYSNPRSVGAQARLHAVGSFDIVAGERSSLTLRYQAAAEQRLLAVRGHVRFDRGWLAPGMDPLPGSVWLQSCMPSAAEWSANGCEVRLDDGENDDERRFQGGSLPVGAAIATFLEWPYRVAFTVAEPLDGADESAVVELAIPAPTALTVRAVAHAGDATCIAADLRWVAASEPRALEQFPGSPMASGSQPVDVRLPAGNWRFFAAPQGAFGREQRFDRRVDRSGESIELVVCPSARLEVEFREGKTLVPADFQWLVCSRVTGPGVASGALVIEGAWDESVPTVMIDGEGPALLSIDEPPGYAPIAPIEVELVRGATVQVSVALERLRR